MWKIKDTGRYKRRVIGLIAIMAVAVFFIAFIFFIIFLAKTITGELDIENGFYRCMAVIGAFFIEYVILGCILKYIEKN